MCLVSVFYRLSFLISLIDLYSHALVFHIYLINGYN